MLCECAVLYDGFGVFDVDIAEVVVPVFVCDLRSLGELAISQGGIDLGGGCGEFVEYPKFGEGFVACLCRSFLRSEILVKFAQDIFGCLVDFVAEPAVPMHLLYIEVDIAAYRSISPDYNLVPGSQANLPPVV